MALRLDHKALWRFVPSVSIQKEIIVLWKSMAMLLQKARMRSLLFSDSVMELSMLFED